MASDSIDTSHELSQLRMADGGWRIGDMRRIRHHVTPDFDPGQQSSFNNVEKAGQLEAGPGVL